MMMSQNVRNVRIFSLGFEKDCGVAKIPSSYTYLAIPLNWASITQLRRHKYVNIATSFIANNRRILIEELYTFSCDDEAFWDNRNLKEAKHT